MEKGNKLKNTLTGGKRRNLYKVLVVGKNGKLYDYILVKDQ